MRNIANAIDQAEVAAGNTLGGSKAYVAKPWFWSDQYDMKLQIAALFAGADQVIPRDVADGLRSVWYLRAGQLVAVDAFQAPRDYMIGKRLVEASARVDPAILADAEADLKALLG